MDSEQAQFEKSIKQIEEWWATERFKNVTRPYTAKDIASLRPSHVFDNYSNVSSHKLFGMLTKARLEKKFHHTWGALDPVQVVNLAKYQSTVYVSGWQCSSTASTTNHPGPDFADYPYDTVPNKVDQLVKALQFHDRKQNQSRMNMTEEQRQQSPKVDLCPPIIADADAGFGGTTSVQKLVQLFVQSGAAGIHMEDQRAGFKKCGHMGGKVLVSTREQCNRLIACRMQADIMGSELMIVCRTDSLSAKLLDSNIDPIDHPYILGIHDVSKPNQLLTFPQVGEAACQKLNNQTLLDEWKSKCYDMSLQQAQEFAKQNGFEFYFDWESPRTAEGFYRIAGTVQYSARRGIEFLKYGDILWMETDKPDLARAKLLTDIVKKVHPTKLFAYNLSPSFNWSTSGMTDDQIQSFCSDLGALGFVWQFITLAGFHMNALASEKFAKEFQKDHMISYVKRIQRKEGKHSVDQLTHQKWSGTELVDMQVNLVTNNFETNSQNQDSTENQFKK